MKSNDKGRVDLGALFEVTSISALGYVFPVSTQFISSSCHEIVVPHAIDGTVFIPANLLSTDLFPQLLCPVHQVMSRSESGHVICSLPDAIRSCETNGAVINLPPPGVYVVRLYCREGVRNIPLRVIEAISGCDLLSLNEGASCELREPFAPVDCRISSITCQDKNLVISVAGSHSEFKKMRLSVWLCSCFPIGTNFDGMSRATCQSCIILQMFLFCSTCRHSSADIFALAPHFVRTARSITKRSLPNTESRTRNLFESGVKLGHEALYILNRKKQKALWLGVSLPRASLVSVPVEVCLLCLLHCCFVLSFSSVPSQCSFVNSLEVSIPTSEKLKKENCSPGNQEHVQLNVWLPATAPQAT